MKGGREGGVFEEEKIYVENRRHAIDRCHDYGTLFVNFSAFRDNNKESYCTSKNLLFNLVMLKMYT